MVRVSDLHPLALRCLGILSSSPPWSPTAPAQAGRPDRGMGIPWAWVRGLHGALSQVSPSSGHKGLSHHIGWGGAAWGGTGASAEATEDKIPKLEWKRLWAEWATQSNFGAELKRLANMTEGTKVPVTWRVYISLICEGQLLPFCAAEIWSN